MMEIASSESNIKGRRHRPGHGSAGVGGTGYYRFREELAGDRLRRLA